MLKCIVLIEGLIPPVVRSLEDQVQRNLGHLRNLPDNVSKNLFLQELHNRNETLYHRLLLDNVSETQFCIEQLI